MANPILSIRPGSSFLGLCSYYRLFVCGFASVAAPLHHLREQQSLCVAFQRLKQVLSQAPVLAYPTSEGAFVLDTDASNTGIGAVLSETRRRRESYCLLQLQPNKV